MSNSINAELYERLVNDEGFINDVWNHFDTTTKIGILEKSGINLLEEYAKAVGSAEEHE